jgi:hypothetical protein
VIANAEQQSRIILHPYWDGGDEQRETRSSE